MPRALLSVSDKTGLAEFGRALATRGFELVSTGGTARALEQAGLPVIGISDVTGFPEMMDGRVKTLHPLVHGGILARRARPEDLALASAHGITLIDVVVVNLYPFVRAASNAATTVDGLIEEIDIGGPSLVRAAAKNFADVLVVVAPEDYPAVIEQLDRSGGPAPEFRFALARKAFAHTGRYDTAIAATLETITAGPDGLVRGSAPLLPSSLPVDLRKVRDLRYGENPHQPAALYEGFGGHPGFTILQGKELSYTNLLDLDAAARIVLEFREPAAVVIKHTNPCGAATGADAADVRVIEAVTAPAVDDAARPILAAKPNMRVVIPGARGGRAAAAQTSPELEMRSIIGGVLVQARDVVQEAHGEWPAGELKVVTKRQPTAAEWQALRFAWRICAHVKSNTVMFASSDRTLAIGAGQMSRVDAVNVARMKAASMDGNPLAGSVAASDAFFPFRDGLDAVASAGATAVVQPGGSVRDPEVIAAADEHGLAMVFTGRRHFRH